MIGRVDVNYLYFYDRYMGDWTLIATDVVEPYEVLYNFFYDTGANVIMGDIDEIREEKGKYLDSRSILYYIKTKGIMSEKNLPCFLTFYYSHYDEKMLEYAGRYAPPKKNGKIVFL